MTELPFFRGVTAKGFSEADVEPNPEITGAERSGAAVAGTEMFGAERPASGPLSEKLGNSSEAASVGFFFVGFAGMLICVEHFGHLPRLPA